MNNITIIGRAGRDPETRFFESGSQVCNLTLACSGIKRDEPTTWFNLEIWGKQAQVAADYVRKGSQIAVNGSIRTEEWTDRATGDKKSKLVVNVQRLQLLGSKTDNGNGVGSVADVDGEALPF